MKKYCVAISSMFVFCFYANAMDMTDGGAGENKGKSHTEAVDSEKTFGEALAIILPEVGRLQSKCEGKRVIMCVGGTGVGKSTLCNVLKLGKPGEMLEVEVDGGEEDEFDEKFELPSELTNADKTEFAGIGHSTQSCTKLPDAYDFLDSDTVFLDTKGFFDNAASTVIERNLEIAGTILLEAMLSVARSVRIVCLQNYDADFKGRLDVRFGKVFQKIVTSRDAPVLFLFSRGQDKGEPKADARKQNFYKKRTKKGIEGICSSYEAREKQAKEQADETAKKRGGVYDEADLKTLRELNDEEFYVCLLRKSIDPENEQYGYWDPTSLISMERVRVLMQNPTLEIDRGNFEGVLNFRNFSKERMAFDTFFSSLLNRGKFVLDECRALLGYSHSSLDALKNCTNTEIESIQREIADGERMIDEIEREKADSEHKEGEIEKEKADSEHKMGQFKEEYATSERRINGIEREIADSRSKIVVFQREIFDSERRIDEIKREIADSKCRIIEIERMPEVCIDNWYLSQSDSHVFSGRTDFL